MVSEPLIHCHSSLLLPFSTLIGLFSLAITRQWRVGMPPVIATYSIVGGEMETLDTPNNPAMSAAPRVSKALIAASESVKEAVTKYVEESPSSSTLTDECETLSTFA